MAGCGWWHWNVCRVIGRVILIGGISQCLCVSGLLDKLKEVFVLLPEMNTQKDYERMFQIQLAHKWSSLETSADGLSTSSRSIQSSWEFNYSQCCRKWSVVCMGKQACLMMSLFNWQKTEPQIEPYTSASLEPINRKQIHSGIHLRRTWTNREDFCGNKTCRGNTFFWTLPR